MWTDSILLIAEFNGFLLKSLNVGTMNTFLKCTSALLIVIGAQSLVVGAAVAQDVLSFAELSQSIRVELDEYVPPDNGAPDRTQGSGTR